MTQIIRTAIVTGILGVSLITAASAQTQEETPTVTTNEQTTAPEQKPETQSQTSTVNIVSDEKPSGQPTAASSYGRTEVLRIYSGRQDGNNVIRTKEVPLPESSTTATRSDYEPH